MVSMNIQFLLTGSELMAGDIVDTNSVALSQSLKQHGLEIQRKVTVADEFTVLVNEINTMTLSADVLLVNGGLGPTEDDLTAEALAQVMDVAIAQHPQALAHLEYWCEKRGFPLNASNLKQAQLPSGVDIVPNPVGSAVGFAANVNDCLVICTPGVPVELKAMWQESVLDMILEKSPYSRFSQTEKFLVFGLGEAPIQDRLNKVSNWPDQVELGFRAAPPIVEVKLTIRDESHEAALLQCEQHLQDYLGEHLVCRMTDDIKSSEQHLVSLLAQKKLTVTTAESCTGGLIASRITSVAGSSAVFEAGYVTYSNRIKTRQLGVPEQVLVDHGAVSQPVVEAMLSGALDVSGADLGIAVSGIAGPGGGSEEKPVGTVWLAWGNKDDIRSIELFYPTNRENFQRFIAAAGLDLMRRFILNIEEAPAYFSRRRS
jgi:nicotinamide-nucleotide amidase